MRLRLVIPAAIAAAATYVALVRDDEAVAKLGCAATAAPVAAPIPASPVQADVPAITKVPPAAPPRPRAPVPQSQYVDLAPPPAPDTTTPSVYDLLAGAPLVEAHTPSVADEPAEPLAADPWQAVPLETLAPVVLMTNDGDLTNRLTHPRYGHEKEYRVLLARRPDRDQMDAWGRGVVLEDGYKTRPVDVHYETGQGKGAWVRVIMGEGRKRQIRETCKQLGLPIVRILRIRIGTLRIGGLKPRQWRYLNNDEIKELKTSDARKKEVAKPIERKKTSHR